MNYLDKLWSWKFRILATLLFVSAFIAKYEDGIMYAFLNTLGVYGIYVLGQFTGNEIRKAREQ
jgi:hypothetical protein